MRKPCLPGVLGVYEARGQAIIATPVHDAVDHEALGIYTDVGITCILTAVYIYKAMFDHLWISEVA